jgi:hypothetical protein
MILEIFVFITAFAFIFSVVGYILSNEVMMTVGFLILGLMSFPLLTQSIEYKSGVSVQTNYSYTASQLDSSINNITYEYTAYEDTVMYGIFLMLICVSGLFTTYRLYGGKDED